MALSKDDLLTRTTQHLKQFITDHNPIIDENLAFECLIRRPILLSLFKNMDIYSNEDLLYKVCAENPLVIRYLSKQIKKNLDFFLKLSTVYKAATYCYKYAIFEIQQNVQFRLNLIESNVGATLDFNCGYFYNNKRVIIAGLLKNPKVYTKLDVCITSDVHIVEKLIDINPFIIKYFSPEYMSNTKLINKILHKDGLALVYLKNISINQIVIAINSNNKVLDYLKQLPTYSNMFIVIKNVIKQIYKTKLFLDSSSFVIYNNKLIENHNLHKYAKKTDNILDYLNYHGFYYSKIIKRKILEYILNIKYLHPIIYKKYILAEHAYKTYENITSF
jgi:hypothetical protein